MTAFDRVVAATPGFRERAGQREMAQRIANALHGVSLGEQNNPESAVAVIQAGTGVGKSAAYLSTTVALALALCLAAALMAGLLSAGGLWHAPLAGNFYAVFPHNLMVAVFAPVFYLFGDGVAWQAAGAEVLCLSVMALLLVWRHRENINRLLAGTESKLGAKKA